MTTHLSSRIVWHDRAWDGHICDYPSQNVYCAVQPHIRDGRNDEKEDEYAGKPLLGLNGWQPPCSRDPIAYSNIGYTITHNDPLEHRQLPSCKEDIPPYTVCPSPYRWLREENFRQICENERLDIRGADNGQKESGWVYEPDRQIELLKHFWGKLEKDKSLIFFYCNHGNPLEDNLNRIIIGVSRIVKIGPQLYFGKKPPKWTAEYPVWSRCITHDYENQGVRIPYHEYLRAGIDTSNIICRIPDGSMLDFSYVGEHVRDDTAVGVLERMLQSIQTVNNENKVKGDWSQRIIWLNDVLSEVWQNRGPFPGIGSVLQYLGVDTGTAFQRQILSPMIRNGENAWDFLLAILEGRQKCKEKLYKQAMEQASIRWSAYSKSRRKFISLLVRFELTPQQVQRIANPEDRISSGINATDDQIIDNPYLISEMDAGGADLDIIPLEIIDRGMRPEGEAVKYLRKSEVIPQDDPRRVRGCAVAVLKDAANSGDTLLDFGDTLNRVKRKFPNRRECHPDRELVIGQAAFYQEALDFNPEAETITMGLRHLAELEREVCERLKKRIKRRNNPPKADWSWEPLLKQEFCEGKGTKLPPDVDARARKEKCNALSRIYEARFSVLTGRAGTGKTSVLRVFLNGLEQLEGNRAILLLAPTGKARVRLMERTKRADGKVRDAYTIHQFLMRNNWINPINFTLNIHGGNQLGVPTVIIDEASMIPMDLLGVLFRALDLNKVSRLIIVGDPNQLPPIGPGRPFVDIIAWLKNDDTRHHCLAKLTERARHEDHNSSALLFADGYLSDEPSPEDDVMLSKIACKQVNGDLEAYFWKDRNQLDALLTNRMKALLSINGECEAYKGFNRSIGIADDKNHNPLKAEHWQILSPVRNHEYGSNEINRNIQSRYKRGILVNSRRRGPKPFGEQEIVWTDKVIQTINCRKKAWPNGQGLDYVANGEIGLVVRTQKGYDCLEVIYSTQPEVSYRYYRSQVDPNLELAYALTVHKSQGSDYDIVFLIIPRNASTLSRELLYTGLTRFRKRIVLLIEQDTAVLENMRNPMSSDTLLRNTNLFETSVRPESVERYYAHHLIHRTSKGVLVRSKSEVIVADTLTRLGISYEYEQKLASPNNQNDFRLPDFTVSYEGDIYYWEHLGMLSVPSYREQWDRKYKWYNANGYAERLITSEDGPDGSIDTTIIEKTARERILQSD